MFSEVMIMELKEQKKILIWIEQAANFVERLTIVPCVILGGGMATVVMMGVIARYLIQNPMPWTEEVSRFLMIWVALLGASIAMRQRAHLGLLYFVSMFPVVVQRLVKLFNDWLIMVFLYILTSYGLKMVEAAKVQIEPSTGITMNYPLLCVPISGLLIMIQLGLQIMNDLLNWGTPKSPFKA